MECSRARGKIPHSGFGELAALALGIAMFACAPTVGQERPGTDAYLPVLSPSVNSAPPPVWPNAAPASLPQAAPRLPVPVPITYPAENAGLAPVPPPAPPAQPTAVAEAAPTAQRRPKTTPKRRRRVNQQVEYYGSEFYPGFFPEFPAPGELQAGHEDVADEEDLEEELGGPGEKRGTATLSRREARELRPSRPYWTGEQRVGVQSRQPPKMYRIGLLWWRDDIAEIEGRAAYTPDMSAMEHKISENVHLGGPENGVTWTSEDEYFSLTFHDLTQLDLREPAQQGDPLHGGFIIPRQRWYFDGKVGDYANFTTSINRGYATLDVLDAFVDFNFNPEWLQFRVGRTKTPSQYEYVAMDEANLIGPERSLYVQSFAGNRQLGAMAHGRVRDRMFEYYIGAFNGQRRSFENYSNGVDFFSYLDWRPFKELDIPCLQNLHFVGAYNWGDERQPLSPIAVRTMNQLSNNDSAAFVSPTILEFNPNSFENGPRVAYDFESVYYYKSVGFLTGYQGGYQNYSVVKSINSPFAATRVNANNEFLGVYSSNRTHVPISGWSWQGWWFITGEEITRRRFLVEPRHPFGFYNGALHPGAIELFTKVSEVQLGNDAFTSGLVNPKLWTNQATAFEIGYNWYLNHFVKFTFDYQHTFLGSPVILNESTGTYTKSYDLFLFRTQLYF